LAAVFPEMGRMEMCLTRRSIFPSDTHRMTRASSDRGRLMPGMLPASYARIDSSRMDSAPRVLLLPGRGVAVENLRLLLLLLILSESSLVVAVEEEDVRGGDWEQVGAAEGIIYA